MPPTAVFWPTDYLRREYAEALLQRMAALPEVAQRQFVFYSFSNGGALVLEQIDLLLAHDKR
jgi:hypothetical protein